MKNKILGIVCIMTIAVLGTFSVNLNNSAQNGGDINLEMMISRANAQSETNDWTQWLTQGLNKDEREWERPCPVEQSSSTSGNASHSGTSVGGSHSSSQTNSSGRNDMSCPNGSDNCTSIDC